MPNVVFDLGMMTGMSEKSGMKWKVEGMGCAMRYPRFLLDFARLLG
jgi:hypothetical protein